MNDTKHQKGLMIKGIEEMIGLKGAQFDYAIRNQIDDHAKLDIYCTVTTRKGRCPHCGGSLSHNAGTGDRILTDLDICGVQTAIHLTFKKYQCIEKKKGTGEICGTVYGQEILMADPSARYTRRLENSVAEECLRHNFSDVSQMSGLSITTVRRIAKDHYVNEEAKRMNHFYVPEVLGVDECHLAGQMCFIMTDGIQRTAYEICRDRDPATVRKAFQTIKDSPDSSNLKVITMDMCIEYRNAVYDIFGQRVRVVCDIFHVIKLLNDDLIEVRKKLIEINSEVSTAGLKASALKLRINLEDLTDVDKNDLARQFDAVPGLMRAYALKESFRSIYRCETRREAEKCFNAFCKQMPKKNDPLYEAYQPFRKFINTVNAWHKEVFNYFDTDGANNSFAEAFNGLLDRIQAEGRGYSFDVLRGRAMYSGNTAYRVPEDYE
ncbi:MAG: ISL3 family transposase [Solobacterium sp.]|nr:ISL3 family transposase [Solobacterium sp.]MBR3344100.1 ISL3 family transposase [Solobacterium sp.]